MSRDLVKPIRTELVIRRLALEVTQREIGAALGVTQHAIAYLESKASMASSVETLAKWAGALNGRLELTLTFEDEIEAAAKRLRAFARGDGDPVPPWEALDSTAREYWRGMARVARDA